MTEPYTYTPPPEWLENSDLVWEHRPGGETLGEAWERLFGAVRTTSWVRRYDGGSFFAHLYADGWVSVNSHERQEIRAVSPIPHIEDIVGQINTHVAPRRPTS